MGITSLIKEYGEITGRNPGWEKYMSVADFIEFKKAASQLITIETAPVNNTIQEDVTSNLNLSQIEPEAQPTRPQKEANPTPIQKPRPAPTVKHQQEPLDELAIFKSMGAD